MMKRTDVVLYSKNNSKKLRDLVKYTFPSQYFLIYEVDRSELMNKCWFNLFSYLIIDSHDKSISEDKDMTNIIRDVVLNKRRIILFSNDVEYNYLKSDDILFENLNENIIIGKIGDNIPLLIIKSFDSFTDNIKMIWNIWKLTPSPEVQLYCHGDVYLLTKYKDKFSEFLECMKSSNMMKEKSFEYTDFKFIINLPKSKSDILTFHKLLCYNEVNNIKEEENISFSVEDYFSTLRTKSLGQIVLYSEVLGSSFDFMARFIGLAHFDMDLMVISKVQTQGKGRGNNKWISPMGCAMFTCSLSININSYLGNSMCLIQHILAVSIVESLCTEFKIDDGLLKIKWPNDIYCSNRGKISGIISKASTFSQKFHCILGCGINVSNNDPTVCIYDLIRPSNIYNGKFPSIETVIAVVMNYFEMNISLIQTSPYGIQKFKEKYYKYWMHQDQKVTIKNETISTSGRISGINDFGFLEFVPDDRGSNESVIMLHPDGNSFDMMHNLIIPKK